MKKDISTAGDIRLLVDSFYEKVRQDQLIGYIFNDIARVDWPLHLPRMYSFWENVIFQTGNFTGNPMMAHTRLNQQHPLTEAHFERWIQLFTDTIAGLFEGEKAELAKQRARSIAAIMLAKIDASSKH